MGKNDWLIVIGGALAVGAVALFIMNPPGSPLRTQLEKLLNLPPSTGGVY